MGDGVDMLKIGLKDLRSRITIVPQDPVLFEATLLYNCDPFETCSREDVWKVLEDAQLTKLGPWVQSQAQQSPEDPTEAANSDSVASEVLRPQPQEHDNHEQSHEELPSNSMAS